MTVERARGDRGRPNSSLRIQHETERGAGGDTARVLWLASSEEFVTMMDEL